MAEVYILKQDKSVIKIGPKGEGEEIGSESDLLSIIEDLADSKIITEQPMLSPYKTLYFIQDKIDKSLVMLAEKTAELSHEVSNPLSIVNTSVRILEKQLKKTPVGNDEIFYENFADIKSSIQQISSIFATARQAIDTQKISYKAVSLREIIEDLEKYFTLVKDELGIDLKFQCDGELKKIKLHVVGSTLFQSLFNLINNSIYELKKIKDKGRVKRIELSFSREDGLKIEVRDNGNGIPKDIEDKIFEKNVSTKGEEGTGIGLYLVKKYVELNKGIIIHDSSYTDGAKFVLHFNEESIEAQRKSILFVDDEVDTLSMFQTLLDDQFNIFVSSSASEAFNIFKSNSIDLVISDYRMPDITGLDFYEMISDIRGQVPFILFSGYISEDVVEAAKQFDNFILIEKPDYRRLEEILFELV